MPIIKRRLETVFSKLLSLLSRERTLPPSNSEAERAFSMLTDAKISKRNRLRIRTVNYISVTQSTIRAKNENALHKLGLIRTLFK